MFKRKIIIGILFVFLVLLASCGGKKYPPYEEIYEKLDNAGYMVRGMTTEDEVLEAVQEIVDSYNELDPESHSGYFSSYPQMDANKIHVEKCIVAEKGKSLAFFFYCADEESAVMIGHALNALYSITIGQQMGGQDDNFAYLFSADVNDILKIRKDDY